MVIKIAHSKSQFGGAPACPGLGWQGSKPVLAICAVPSHAKPEQLGESCQLSFWAITVCPENNRSNGLAKVPGTKNGAPPMDGPRERTSTLNDVNPSMIKPPIITLSPVSTRLRVEILPSRTSEGPPPAPPPPPSSSTIVPIPCPSAIVALVALVRLTKKLSLPSTTVSPMTTTATVFVVSPGLKVRVPLLAR